MARDFKVRPTVNGVGVALSTEVSGGPGGTEMPIKQVEVDLGSSPRFGSTFTIADADAAVVVGNQVYVQQAADALTGKGTLADENEMDTLMMNGRVESAGVIRVNWSVPRANGPVRGNFKFNYRAS